jgi:hypothetical protein
MEASMIFWTFLTTVRDLLVEAKSLELRLERRYPAIGS